MSPAVGTENVDLWGKPKASLTSRPVLCNFHDPWASIGSCCPSAAGNGDACEMAFHSISLVTPTLLLYILYMYTALVLHGLILTPQHIQNFNHSARTSMMTFATRNPNSSTTGGWTYTFRCLGTARHNNVDIRFAGRFKKYMVLPLPPGQMPWSSLSKCLQLKLESLWKPLLSLLHGFPSFEFPGLPSDD